MATTTPDNILTPDAGDQYALVQDLGLMADSVQDALTRRGNALKGTAAQRVSALNSSDPGVLWQDTDGIGMIWKRGASAWVPAVPSWFGTTTQMNAFTQAPAGFGWFNTSVGRQYNRVSGSWVPLVQRGTVAPSLVSGTVVTNVTFETPFTSPPIVLVSVSGGGAATFLYVAADSVTTTGFELRRGVGGERASGYTFGANWVAFA